jgi:hypothetical protein
MVPHISNDVKEVALSMSRQGLSDSMIHQYTGISKRSMVRLRDAYRNYAFPGSLLVGFGWPRTLNGIQVKVCMQFFIPDLI